MNVIKELINVNGTECEALTVELPKTTLLIISTTKGFVMCGALDVDIYDSPKLLDRKVLCCKAVGVRSISDLMAANVYQASEALMDLGVSQGMPVEDVIKIIS